MALLHKISISAQSLVVSAVTASLGICATLCPVVASPISLLDRVVDNSSGIAKSAPAVDMASQPRTPSPVITTSNAAPPEDRADADARSAGAAPSTFAPLGWTGEVSVKPSSGETLREVLQSIITWHSADATPAARRPVTAANGGDEDEIGVDLRKLILDSQVGGAMLRGVVDIESADKKGTTFSVLGFGNFALDFAPDLHSAIVSELSSGMAFRMSLGADRLGYDVYSDAALNPNPNGPHENVNLLRVIWNWILDFVDSPVGALLSMAAAITVLLWVCVKSVVFLQRRASRF